MGNPTNKDNFISFDKVYDRFTPQEKIEIELGVIRLDLAEKIRKARKEKGISSEKLSEISGISYKTISKVENAKPVTFETVVKVMESLGLQVTYSLK
jgi:ribosome-binding protein aMBF1 (putative translation factor)